MIDRVVAVNSHYHAHLRAISAHLHTAWQRADGAVDRSGKTDAISIVKLSHSLIAFLNQKKPWFQSQTPATVSNCI